MRAVVLGSASTPGTTGVRMNTAAAVTGVLLLMWAAAAFLIVPVVIRAAYDGAALPSLNRIIAGQSVYPLEFYLGMWRTFAVHSTTAIVAGLAAWATASRTWFFRRFIGPATPGTLGAIRVLVCAVLLITTSWEDMASVAQLPLSLRHPAGFIGILLSAPSAQFLTHAGVLRGLQAATELLLFLGMIGWMTRFVIPLAALGHFLCLGLLVEYSFFWHQGLVPLYLLLALSFMPCGDGWSVDRLVKIYRGDPVPHRPAAIYGLGRYVCWMLVAFPYAESGLSKLRLGGTAWWSPVNMRGMLFADTLNPREYDWHLALRLAHAPDVLFTVLGVITIVLEVGFLLVLVSRTARRILPPAMIAMHVGIFGLQRILFLDLIVLQLIFVDPEPVRAALRRWMAPDGVHVWFDGACALCRRTVRVLRAFDILGALRFHDFASEDDRSADVPRPASLDALQHSMHVVVDGLVFTGFHGYRRIARVLPALWPTVPLAYLPGMTAAGTAVYGWIAARRRHASCDASCGPVPQITVDTLPRRSRRRSRRVFAGTAAALVTTATACFLMRIEFFPFTAWHLYSTADTSGRVTYIRVEGRDASGVPMAVRIEDGIGALALDARYMGALDMCFSSGDAARTCQAFLAANGNAANRGPRRGVRTVAKYDVQKWTWDFLNDPASREHGQLVRRVLVDVPQAQ
jgi:predicted DCC family thiol-disulfide oxidoreductase YuxK